MSIRNRIIGHGEEKPDQLLANPLNFRTHPTQQRESLRGILGEVGWVQSIIVNRRTGYIVDGHARVEEALLANEPIVPVVYVDLSEREEALVLAVLDPIGEMAKADSAILAELLNSVSTGDAALQNMISEMSQKNGLFPKEEKLIFADEYDNGNGEDGPSIECCATCGKPY